MNHPVYSPRLFIILSTAVVLFLAGCQPQISPTEQPTDILPTKPVAAATETLVPAENPNTINQDILLDPALATDVDSLKINQYLYEGLVILDASGNVQPGLAESWVISDDTLDYVFTLRPNIAFSDGSPMTPDNIVDNVNRWFDPKSPLRGSGDYAAWKEVFSGFLGEKDTDGRALSPVDGVQKVDLTTVIIHLNRPVPELLTLLANPAFAILKPEALSDSTYGNSTSNIIASGPYQVSSWTNDSLVLSPNPAYWGEVPQDNLEFSFR